jgi:hypothetical protein
LQIDKSKVIYGAVFNCNGSMVILLFKLKSVLNSLEANFVINLTLCKNERKIENMPTGRR